MVIETHAGMAEHHRADAFPCARLPENGEGMGHVVEKAVAVPDEQNLHFPSFLPCSMASRRR